MGRNPKTLHGWEKKLERRTPGNKLSFKDSMFRFRSRIRMVDRALSDIKPCAPCKWAFRMVTCASTLRYFSGLSPAQIRSHSKFIEASPNTVIRWMHQCAEQCRIRTAYYRSQGMDPCVDLFRDTFPRAKEAILMWQKHLIDERNANGTTTPQGPANHKT